MLVRTILRINFGRLGSQLTLFDRVSFNVLACFGWSLLVCLLYRVGLCFHKVSSNNNWCFIFSWEYVTTFDYEWSVIRGHRPYRWTIWVRGDVPSV
jgi:hypothetical protein